MSSPCRIVGSGWCSAICAGSAAGLGEVVSCRFRHSSSPDGRSGSDSGEFLKSMTGFRAAALFLASFYLCSLLAVAGST